MSIDLEEVRSRNPTETIVRDLFTLHKSGSRYVGIEHNSLVVVPNTGMYFWNSKGEKDNVFDFVGRHVLWRGYETIAIAPSLPKPCYLAHSARITLEATSFSRNLFPMMNVNASIDSIGH